ncbi:hypothetical protein CC78DRAFT_560443 [Lojkania enalia]|uniref:Zn(2)-C6 fungal-type domain-containing protein n=1 Tax=Lojkania enalia TaxID=147567 RepID=A0A9P4KDK6_9PLEO|nr:hypothetical protein CC78DRAFT_560443 [Didymosphaeria enalia]
MVMQAVQKRQCWECLRRRLVCDFGQPACKKCTSSGKECPGYDEKKPLKWLDPGKVTSKSRKRTTTRAFGTSRAVVTTSHKNYSLPKGDKSTPPETETGETGRTQNQPILDFLLDWRDDTSDIVQAVYYYNSHLYPELLVLNEMAPNPYIIFFPLSIIPLLPPSIRHIIVCYSLTYRITTLPYGSKPLSHQSVSWSRVYHHRGSAIQAIREEIGGEGTRSSDKTIAAVLMLLCYELQYSAVWRHHVDGLAKLINLRGGIETLFESAKYLRPSIVLFVVIGIFANTTSPPSEQITVTDPSRLTIIVMDWYDTIFPHTMVPQALFLDIININLLRFRYSQTRSTADCTELQIEAEDILMHIGSFSPEAWVDSMGGSFREEWLQLSSLFQSATTLYCILSLQSLSILPDTPHLRAIRNAHGDLLGLLIEKCLKDWRTRKYLMWPMVVFGVEAVARSSVVQNRLDEQLMQVKLDMGTLSPMRASDLLKRFWASGKTGWDDCFDDAYAFIF